MTRRDTRTVCGLCGRRTRYIGSHVLDAHVPYLADLATIDAARLAERDARRSAAAR